MSAAAQTGHVPSRCLEAGSVATAPSCQVISPSGSATAAGVAVICDNCQLGSEFFSRASVNRGGAVAQAAVTAVS